MNEMIFQDFLVFAGLMALLGTIAKITLTLITRKRGGALPSVDAKVLEEINERLARLEQVTDATAIEIERIGEGQRFTTKLLSERTPAK
ncbi:MAG: hypothetical protein KGL93_13215 [Gemmatimonadota bacterium]|nr:hypothetical protein [Gemmatimonadota bacterium]HEU4990310.1 hypothetical protein [Gemmatimonadaceae bacterium]